MSSGELNLGLFFMEWEKMQHPKSLEESERTAEMYIGNPNRV